MEKHDLVVFFIFIDQGNLYPKQFLKDKIYLFMFGSIQNSVPMVELMSLSVFYLVARYSLLFSFSYMTPPPQKNCENIAHI